jgi:RimJ/RimL family protein N-acetyltransferase
VVREVRPLILTRANLLKFYEKAQKHRVLFSDDVNGDFKKFCEVFISQCTHGEIHGHGLLWVIDDFVGVYYITHITELDAQVHFTFFDGRFKGRTDLTREMLSYGFKKYGFARLSVEVGYYVPQPVFRFILDLGFKQEGRRRKAVMYKGELFDVACFGILREDLNGN